MCENLVVLVLGEGEGVDLYFSRMVFGVKETNVLESSNMRKSTFVASSQLSEHKLAVHAENSDPLS